MSSALTLPKLVFGPGKIAELAVELALLGITRTLLVSDRGLERAGTVALVRQAAPALDACFLDIPENPTAAGADLAATAYRQARCDGIVALGGGSVIDTAKLVAALVTSDVGSAAALIGKAELITAPAATLIAIPTTVGTGSESSLVAALHIAARGPAIGTRSVLLVPKVALCDPDLARTLPPRLIAATGIDALSHCIEGYFAEPANPEIDALALDGIARVCASIHAALEPSGDDARGSLMMAAFAGGAAIHKGLGPAHAVALACGDQDIHHGTLIAAALPHTTRLLAQHVPGKAAHVAAAMGLGHGEEIGDALAALTGSLGLPATIRAAGYRMDDLDKLVAELVASPFNRTSPYVPTSDEYRSLALALLA